MNKPNILAFAGYDPSGGAGVLRDVKTIESCGGYGMAISSVHTIQTTYKVYESLIINEDILRKQMDVLFKDEKIGGMKIGLTDYHMNWIHEYFNYCKYIVMDPVISSSSGYEFMDKATLNLAIKKVFPSVSLLTPNIDEALKILDLKEIKDYRQAVMDLGEKCQCPILLKGGHGLDGIDILYDGKKTVEFEPKEILSYSAHGTGCALSSGIVTYLAQGEPLIQAIRQSKDIVFKQIKSSEGGRLNVIKST